MRAIHRITLGVGISIFLTSSSLWAQKAPGPPAPPAPAPQPYPPQPYPQPAYAPPGYAPPGYALTPYGTPPPYGAPQPYYGPPGPYGYAPAPVTIPYREGPAPAGYHLEENPRRGLVISGAVVFGVAYGLSLSIGLASTNDSDKWLLVPLLGPLGTMASRSNTCKDDVACVFEPVIRIYLALDFVMQATGTLLLTLGYALPKKEFVADHYNGASLFRLKSWAVAPRMFEGSKPGLALTGEIF